MCVLGQSSRRGMEDKEQQQDTVTKRQNIQRSKGGGKEE
jgi:hypothetical protein